MMKHFLRLFSLTLLCATCFSCQKADYEEENGKTSGKPVLRFQVSQFEQMPFDVSNATRSTDISAACTRLNFAVYQDGEKIEQINQLSSDAGFGTIDLSLSSGRYLVVLLAHSCDGNATMTDPKKITFPNNKLTDTFWYADSVIVDNDSVYQLKMKRAVAMFRLQTTDTVPAEVKTVRFWFTGGSSTFDALSGVGCVNSKQWENFSISDDMTGKTCTFEVYTFPKTDSNGLNLKVSKLNKTNSVLSEIEISNIPVERNVITLYKGNIFSQTSGSKGGFSIDLYSDDEWTTHTYAF